MSHASDRANARNKLVGELADQFDASGIEYTCGAVIIDWVKKTVTAEQLAATFWTSGRCAQRVWDEVHARWKVKKNAPE